jgi:hypothetical protein
MRFLQSALLMTCVSPLWRSCWGIKRRTVVPGPAPRSVKFLSPRNSMAATMPGLVERVKSYTPGPNSISTPATSSVTMLANSCSNAGRESVRHTSAWLAVTPRCASCASVTWVGFWKAWIVVTSRPVPRMVTTLPRSRDENLAVWLCSPLDPTTIWASLTVRSPRSTVTFVALARAWSSSPTRSGRLRMARASDTVVEAESANLIVVASMTSTTALSSVAPPGPAPVTVIRCPAFKSARNPFPGPSGAVRIRLPAVIEACSTSFSFTSSVIEATRSMAPGTATCLPTSVVRRLPPASVNTAELALIDTRSRNRPSGTQPSASTCKIMLILPANTPHQRAHRAPRNLIEPRVVDRPSLDGRPIDVQKMPWKFRAGGHEQAVVSLPIHFGHPKLIKH